MEKIYKEGDIITKEEASILNISFDTLKDKNLKKSLKQMQIELQHNIQNTGYNIVTCGNCGSVIIHDVDIHEIICPNCLFKGEPSDFPYLNY